MKVKIINNSNHPLPKYETLLSAGMDLRANLEAPVTLNILERALVPTGLYIQLQPGTEAQIRPRSGIAYKTGLTVLNAPGTIDADYIGEIKVLIVNLSDEPATIKPGERIAQMVIAKHETVSWHEVEVLEDTERMMNGFGSTGRN